MGVSIDARAFNVEEVARSMRDFLDENRDHVRPEAVDVDPVRVITQFGNYYGYLLVDYLVVVYNEHYEGYNPLLNMVSAINMFYFGTESLYGLGIINDTFPWLEGIRIPGGGEPMDQETAADMGFDYPEDDDDC